MRDGAKSAYARGRETWPGYWPNETSGVLVPVVTRYLNGEPLNAAQLRIMKSYIAQWVDAPVWRSAGGTELEELRAQVKRIETEAQLHAAIDAAIDLGMDPL